LLLFIKKNFMRQHLIIIRSWLGILLPAVGLFCACTKTKWKTSPPVTITDTVTVSDTAGGAVPMGPIRPYTASSNPYVTQLFDYDPAPGQFINTTIADYSAAQGVVGNANGLVSLGAFGGYVVFGFDHTVFDSAGPDLMVVGNATTGFAEPGVVWVMQDQNGNGKPDDTWYELAGSETGQPGYMRNYSVTYSRPNPPYGNVPWKDNKGNSGYVLTTIYHTQDYYPDSLSANSYTLSGTLLPFSNIDTTDPANVVSYPFAYGYCDNTPGGNPVDIAMAVDSLGRSVRLKGIDFVKIQTGVEANLGLLGEFSTEVSAVWDVHLLPVPASQ
jgi:hypothetical protein